MNHQDNVKENSESVTPPPSSDGERASLDRLRTAVEHAKGFHRQEAVRELLVLIDAVDVALEDR